MITLRQASTWLTLFASSVYSTPSKPWGDWNGQQHLTVKTTNGPVTGHPATNVSNVIEYLGIPFAQPPIGDLRFAPPAKYTGSEAYIASDWVCKAHVSHAVQQLMEFNRDMTAPIRHLHPSKGFQVKHPRLMSF